MPRPPNIFLFITDQHRHDALGCVDRRIQTPHLDALAARGLRFSNAVCNAPMCVPSRYSLMTGLYASQVGVRHNTQMIPTDADLPVPTLAMRLAQAGYQTAGVGKTHWYIGERIMPGVKTVGSRRGFEFRALAGGPGPENDEPGSRYQATDDPAAVAALGAENAQGGPGGEAVGGYVGAPSTLAGDRHREGWLARQAQAFLGAERDPARPFFLYLGFDYPHPGFFVPPGFEERYRLDDFPDLPPPDPIPGGHMHGRLEDRWNQMTADQRRRSHLRYAALCTYIDDLIGQVVATLRAQGELDNTFILFASDHGDMLGDRGRVSKYCLYEGSVRVPLILAGPNVPQRGVVDARPAELVDLVPTLCSAAGAPAPDELPGVNLLSTFSRPGSFSEMHGRGYEQYQRAPAVMYRADGWKIILYRPERLGDPLPPDGAYAGELYDLAEDPRELRDRFADPACAAVRERLTALALLHVMNAWARHPATPSRAQITLTEPETRADKSLWYG
ncbi:MAG: sulfatase family protein [Planctomycetota bacterium]